MDRLEFVKLFLKHFRNSKTKIVFEMGGLLEENDRVTQTVDRFKQIADFIFTNKELWVVLVLWDIDRSTREDLIKCGFRESLAAKSLKGKKEDGLLEKAIGEYEIKYIQFTKYSFELISPLIHAIAGYELGFENGANISAYFLSFQSEPVLLNLYDDRGMELLCNNSNLAEVVSSKFKEYIQYN